MTQQIHAELARYQPGRRDTERFLLRYLSEPKATTVFDTPTEILPPRQFQRRATARGLQLDRRTRIVYSNAAIGVNGERITPPLASMATIKTLADQRKLSAVQAQRAPAPAWPLLHGWYSAGWIAFVD